MSKPLKIYATIKDGNLEFMSPDWVRQKMAELPDDNYTLTIEKYFSQRSNNQNRYYWGCLIPLVKDGLREIGYNEIDTSDDAHQVLKALFLKKQITNKNTGEVIEAIGTTKKLSTVEFNDYIDKIAQWCSEYLGFVLPMPNEQLNIALAYNDSDVDAIIIDNF